MGIKGLTTYVKEHFKGWKTVNFESWDHVVVDGNNVCLTLYKQNFPWVLGGEYAKFSDKVKEFFKQFQNPVVVFDGAKFDLSKMETVRRRHIEYMGDLESIQRLTWPNDDTSTGRILPALVISTSLVALKEMGIECLVADGEADREMAALANHHDCPVLGSDSDLFIFNLKQGFIHFNRLYAEGKPDALFHIDEFLQHLKLREYDLCLFIPAYFGNDIVKPKSQERYYDYEKFLSELSKNESCEDFLASAQGKDIPRSEFRSLKKYYSSLEWPVEKPSFPKNLPKWVYENYKTGNFSIGLVDVCINRARIMPRVVEVIKCESAWQISRRIRQQIYHILGLSAVTEEIRRNSLPILTVETVTAINCSASLRDGSFRGENKEEMSTLMFNIMVSQQSIKSEFDNLLEKWKLPIAATFYWYQNLDEPLSQVRGLLMSLLLSFLTCSDDLPRRSFPFAPSVTSSTKEDHLKVLHAFAKWQCVYLDARSLNYLTRAFPTTSPGRLYSGEVVMHFAALSKQDNWLNSVFALQHTSGGVVAQHNPAAWQLFNNLLFLVSGHDECGRVWSKILHHD